MIIVEVEGLDKSGKRTFTDKLVSYYSSKGLKVVKSSFHRYETPTGKLIQDWLYGRYPVDTLSIKLIMTADKQAQQQWFEELEKEGVDVLILDRYFASNLVYSQGEGLDMEWINTLQNKLRKPDVSLLLDISPQTSISRKGEHGDNDRYEKNIKLLTKVRENYLKYFESKATCGEVEGEYIVLRDIDTLSVDEVFALGTKALDATGLL